jgi:hypothetical protein
MAAHGYHHVVGNLGRIWLAPTYNINGGSVGRWQPPTDPTTIKYWSQYNAQVAIYGQPNVIWVNLCEHWTDGNTYDQVKLMLSTLRQYSPNATIYISAINTYNPVAGLCTFMGPLGQGETDTQQWAAQAVADGLALTGPQLGPLTATMIEPSDPSHCHPTQQGMMFLGQQLAAFFDSL